MSLSSMLGLDKEVLEIDSGLAFECAEVVEVEGESDGLTLLPADDGLGFWGLEEPVVKVFVGDDAFFAELFVVGERLDKAADDGDVFWLGGEDLHFYHL